MIDGVSGYSNNNSGMYGGDSTTLGKDDFMKLMIQQLKNQDPLDPMDSADYASQLAEFSSLEQLSNLNEYMKESIDANYVLTQSINNTLTANLIGKDVKFEAASVKNTGNNTAEFGYTLPANADKVTVNIYDANGKLVKKMEGQPSSQGDHKLSWDFTDNDGKKLANGDYRIEVKALSDDETEMNTSVFQYGAITGIKFSDEGTKILINGVEYLLSDVIEIMNASTTSTNDGESDDV